MGRRVRPERARRLEGSRVTMLTDRGRILTHDPHDFHDFHRLAGPWSRMWQCITNVPR